MTLVLSLLLSACGGDGPGPAVELQSESARTRLHGVLSLSQGEIVANLDVLIEMAASDPSEEVRREVIRELGYSGEPRVLPVLERYFGGPYEELAAQSMAYLVPEGCDRLAELWVTSPGTATRPDPFEFSVTLGDALSLHNGHCLQSLVPYVDSHPDRVRFVATTTPGGNPTRVVLLEALEAAENR